MVVDDDDDLEFNIWLGSLEESECPIEHGFPTTQTASARAGHAVDRGQRTRVQTFESSSKTREQNRIRDISRREEL